MSIIETAKYIYELAKKGGSVELQERILQLREEALTVQEEILRLRIKVKELEVAQALRQNPKRDEKVYPQEVPAGRKGIKMGLSLIWEKDFWCGICAKTIKGKIFSRTGAQLPENEREYALDYLKHRHETDTRISCWKCETYIRPHEIEDIIWVEGQWKELCRDCAQI